jgi:hypothetical protein
MPFKASYVFVWRWPDAKKAFVFVGDESEPGRLWHARFEKNSTLNDKLKTLDDQPLADSEHSFSFSMYSNQARALCKLTANKLRAQGYKLLSARCKSTYVAGPQKPRPVYCMDAWGKQVWFKSIGAASRALGLSSLTIRLRCDQNRPGWRYDTP